MWSLIAALCWMAAAPAVKAEPVRVSGVKAVHRNGQTFVTWTDAADSAAGARFRYALYRSDRPITQNSLGQAERCYGGVLNNSAKLFGYAFWQKDRLNAETPRFPVWENGTLVRKAMPTFIIEEGGQPLPMWSGLAVRTVTKNGQSYYAVVATDVKGTVLSRVEPGESATTEPVDETVAPIQPIKLMDSKNRGRYARSTSITGKKGLPLTLSLHGSQSRGGGASSHGDLYVYFGTPAMGWRDGLPGIFTVMENHTSPSLTLATRDAVESPSGNGVVETCWFGYFAVPEGAEHKEPRAYPYTERRLEWLLKWVIDRYKADPERVYSSGQSMGGMGSTQFSFRHPDLFAAVYPRLGRVRQTWLPSIAPGARSVHKGRWEKPVPMFDGKTDYWTRMDTVKWAAEHHDDLPFYGWCFGRTDTVAPWPDQIEMVKVLTENHHGFAFSWNNEGHSSAGAKSIREIMKYYPSSKFARNLSYPAFGNSSVNSNMGNGKRDDGDLVGGINLGFIWTDVVDQPATWSVKLSNDLAKAPMTVDVTPRRCQQFKAKPGDTFHWTNTAGGEGEVIADQWGLVTIKQVTIKPGEPTTLTIERK